MKDLCDFLLLSIGAAFLVLGLNQHPGFLLAMLGVAMVQAERMHREAQEPRLGGARGIPGGFVSPSSRPLLLGVAPQVVSCEIGLRVRHQVLELVVTPQLAYARPGREEVTLSVRWLNGQGRPVPADGGLLRLGTQVVRGGWGPVEVQAALPLARLGVGPGGRLRGDLQVYLEGPGWEEQAWRALDLEVPRGALARRLLATRTWPRRGDPDLARLVAGAPRLDRELARLREGARQRARPPVQPRVDELGAGVSAARCGVCDDPLSGTLHLCPGCEAGHHAACWDFNRGCSTYACAA